MEKYNDFADKTTGINPFIPTTNISSRSFIEWIFYCLYAPILILIRLPLILTLFTILSIYNLIIKRVILIYQKPITNFINSIVYNLISLIF